MTKTVAAHQGTDEDLSDKPESLSELFLMLTTHAPGFQDKRRWCVATFIPVEHSPNQCIQYMQCS